MAKMIENPIEVTLKFERNGNVWGVNPVVHYGVGLSEYPELDVVMRKSLGLTFTPSQETQLKTFAADVIYPQIVANEGI